jgi:putative hydrolase of the HAD superfamily
MTPAYVFDLFGTLVPLPEPELARREVLACARTLRVDEDRFAARWKETYRERNRGDWAPDLAGYLRQLLETMNVEADEAAIARAVEGRREFARRLLVVAPETMTVLARLRDDGSRLGIISVCGPAVAEVWAGSALPSLVDVVLLSCTAGLMKPDPTCYLRVCRDLGVSPADSLYIGDGAGDELAGAAAAGLRPILLESPASAAAGYAPASWSGPRIASLGELIR